MGERELGFVGAAAAIVVAAVIGFASPGEWSLELAPFELALSVSFAGVEIALQV